MELLERSYSGKIFRPRPEIHCDPQGNLCIVATPWGNRSVAKKVIQSILDFFMSARADEEVTSPFATITTLSPMANNLRISIMLANDTIRREENRAEYHGGVELFVGAKFDREFCFAQIGGPHLLLNRSGFDLQVLSGAPDLALYNSGKSQLLAPLPNALLGISETSNFAVQTARLEANDQLILLHRSLIPPRLLALSEERRDLKGLSQVLANHSPDLPFWLGLLNLE